MTRPETHDSSPDRLRRRASRLLSQLTTRSDRLVGEGLAGADARKWHYAVLASLADGGPASQATLSRRTGIYRSDMVRVLDELTDRRLVDRSPDPADQRRNIVTLSPEGSRRLRRLDEVLDDVHEVLLAPLDQDERDQFLRLLTRLVDHHTEPGPLA
ncbi:MarR family winged helix-turn-helix transcriptional regulator [Streptomyces sp. NRRL F-5727]|uniref:MarR family winged helix-turn-helix transcriptional regulator n=1 Tax=Streptomyces sp. NRRL F-5727 TaxID=1463871 RepID=UPI0004C56D5E|nr:MarR family winged helix-turn-helix transcriptional regulator [Streptomyces sp. NRRL F-5727]